MELGGETLGNFLVSSTSTLSLLGRVASLPCDCCREVKPRGPMYPIGINGMGTSSSSSSSEDSDVRLASSASSTSSSDTTSSSLSLEDSVHVDGSYSCFKGDDERRLFLKADKVGVNTGVLEPFNVTGVAGLGDRCGGGGGGSSISSSASSSLLGSRCLIRTFGGADADVSRDCFVPVNSLVGVVGWLVLRDRGIVGSSIDGTDETLR
jgi:hypothetical protein